MKDQLLQNAVVISRLEDELKLAKMSSTPMVSPELGARRSWLKMERLRREAECASALCEEEEGVGVDACVGGGFGDDEEEGCWVTEGGVCEREKRVSESERASERECVCV
eukprot:3916254-Rhodomonas_salina.1